MHVLNDDADDLRVGLGARQRVHVELDASLPHTDQLESEIHLHLDELSQPRGDI